MSKVRRWRVIDCLSDACVVPRTVQTDIGMGHACRAKLNEFLQRLLASEVGEEERKKKFSETTFKGELTETITTLAADTEVLAPRLTHVQKAPTHSTGVHLKTILLCNWVASNRKQFSNTLP